MSNGINEKIDDALYNFFQEADEGTIKEFLQDDIPNLEEYNKKKKQIIFLAKATVKKTHNEYLLQLANKFQEAFIANIEKPIAIFNQLVQGNSSPAFYQNLNKLTKEDIIEIIKDKNLIQLLEQIEQDDKDHLCTNSGQEAVE
ncbi:MAG TPA: hypothetical protein P5531_13810 [Bacteroidales bacterium]|nr:hypothetical protein [Bacteroidales bacterium]HSA44668.1 hypothetical protein [Bacteroidales bacterium]